MNLISLYVLHEQHSVVERILEQGVFIFSVSFL